MKKVLSTTLVCIMLAVSIAVSGCMIGKKNKTVEEIIAMYNEKYDDKFTFLSGGYALWNANYDEFLITSEKLDNAVINIRAYDSGNIYDNYIEVKYKKEMENRVSTLAETIYGDCVVINVPASFGSGRFSENTTFEEYASSEYSYDSTAILVNKNHENGESDIKELRNMLEGNKLLTEIRVYYFDISSTKDVKVVDESFLEFAPKATQTIIMTMNSDYSIKDIKWR